MTRLQFTITVCSVLCAYLFVILWQRPVTTNGRFIRGLSIANVASWILLLLLGGPHGHPPDWVIYGVLLWLINSPLLIVSAVAVWICFKSRDENKVFAIAAAVYVGLNIATLWVLPAVLVLLASVVGSSAVRL